MIKTYTFKARSLKFGEYRKTFLVSFIISLLLAAPACSDRHRNPDLVKVAALADNSPSEAIRLLDSLDYRSLSKHDRHLYDLLLIKSRDKAYIRHTSDSLILDVIGYFSKQKDIPILAEALYYGGRVYCDLGDYPTAMLYFQKALDTIPDDRKLISLRASVSSQYGALLRRLRLYHEAIPHIEKSLEADRILKDTVNEVYDLQLLGDSYLKTHDYEKAGRCFHEALEKSAGLPDSFSALSSLYLASLKYATGDNDSALFFVRGTPDRVKSVSRNFALTYAARIYLRKGLEDSAFMYAKDLIESPRIDNKQSGYHIILMPEMRKYVHPDSIGNYISQYRTLLETLYDENEINLALSRQASYNYSLHERARIEAEEAKAKRSAELLIVVIICFVLVGAFLFVRYRNIRNKLLYQQALQDLEELRKSVVPAGRQDAGEANVFSGGEMQEPEDKTEIAGTSNRILKEKLREELIKLYRESDTDWTVPDNILNSEAYAKLQKHIAEEQMINESDPLWGELEAIVLKSTPDLKRKMLLLTSGNLKRADFQTALLIKCGVRPNNMGVLLGRTKGAISSRRENLCIKLLGLQMGSKAFDSIIRRM